MKTKMNPVKRELEKLNDKGKRDYKELRKKVIKIFAIVDVIAIVIIILAGIVLETVLDFRSILVYLTVSLAILAVILESVNKILMMDKCYRYINEKINDNPQGYVRFSDLPLLCQYVIYEDNIIRNVLFSVFDVSNESR